jgi:hypothetical protein
MNPFDLWDQATITEFVRLATDRVLGDEERIAGQFAPREPTQLEKIAKGKIKLKAVGRGRGVVADDATPPIYRPEIRFEEQAYSLMRLTEMTPIEESLRRQLQMNGSDSETVALRDRAGVDIITRVRAIAVRQENLSDYLVMQAILNGQLAVKVANPPGQTAMDEFVIDYEYPTGAITQAPTSFDNLAAAKPVDVLRAMQQQVKNTSGRYGTEFTLSSEVMNYILQAADTIGRFNFSTNVTAAPAVNEEMLKTLLFRSGGRDVISDQTTAANPGDVTFNVTDAGWFDEMAGYGTGVDGFTDSDKTRWVPKDTIICEAPSPAGDPLAQMYDGMVPVQTDWDQLEYRGPGAQTYQQLLQGNLTMHYRWEARRMPMIHHPERICVNKVVF